MHIAVESGLARTRTEKAQKPKTKPKTVRGGKTAKTGFRDDKTRARLGRPV